ncbi:MAG: STM3941 family protein [Pseudomonadota bacterium]
MWHTSIWLAFCALGIWLTQLAVGSDDRLALTIWGCIFAIFFGGLAILSLKLLLLKAPTLVATDEGMKVRWQFGPAYGPIRWDEIDAIEVNSEYDGRRLRFCLRDPSLTQRRLGKRWMLFGWSNLNAHLDLPDIQLDRKPAVIAQELCDKFLT